MKSNISNTPKHSLISTTPWHFLSARAVHVKIMAVWSFRWTARVCVYTRVPTTDNWNRIKSLIFNGQPSAVTVSMSNALSSNTNDQRWKWPNRSNYKRLSPRSCTTVSNVFWENYNSWICWTSPTTTLTLKTTNLNWRRKVGRSICFNPVQLIISMELIGNRDLMETSISLLFFPLLIESFLFFSSLLVRFDDHICLLFFCMIFSPRSVS